MVRHRGLHRVGSTDIQKARVNCQRAVNKMIREHDAALPCISCGRFVPLDAGHFISVGEAPGLRFHPWNINGQCRHENGYKGGRTWEYGRGLDIKYGAGTSEALKALPKTANMTIDDLLYLTDAARHGFRVYFQAYRERFPHHFPMRKSAQAA
jgi:hypothetical protein